MVDVSKERIGVFAAALAARAAARPVEPFDVQGFFGLGDLPIPKLGVRIPTQHEQDRALAGAHRYVAEVTGDSPDAKQDPDLLLNAKQAHIAFEFCRELESDGAGTWTPTGYPAFPSPTWAAKHLTVEQIAVLVNLANEVRAKHAPSPVELDDATLEAVASVCATHAGGDLPEAVLAGYPREWLTHALVLVSLKLQAARAALDAQAPTDPAPPPAPAAG